MRFVLPSSFTRGPNNVFYQITMGLWESVLMIRLFHILQTQSCSVISSCNLSLLDAEKEEWICTRCNVSYFPNRGEKVKRANRFETPGPETDKHGNITGEKMPLVSIVKDDKELSSTYGKEKLPALFKEMERRGVKITSYTTTEDR